MLILYVLLVRGDRMVVRGGGRRLRICLLIVAAILILRSIVPFFSGRWACRIAFLLLLGGAKPEFCVWVFFADQARELSKRVAAGDALTCRRRLRRVSIRTTEAG